MKLHHGNNEKLFFSKIKNLGDEFEMKKRKVSQIFFAEHPDQGKKCWIRLSDCNFDCKGCFATYVGKQEIGRSLSTEELTNLILKYDKKIDRMVITGGEPLLDENYLINLIKKSKENFINKFEIHTNAYLLNENLLKKLSNLNVDVLFSADIKAFDDNIHKKYTGKSNANVLKAISLLSEYKDSLYKDNPSFIVNTPLMPGVVDTDEIEKTAKFLSETDENVCYRIAQFLDQFLPSNERNLTRTPTFEEMINAYNVARKHLDYVIIDTYLPTGLEHNYKNIIPDELLDTFKEFDKKYKSVIESRKVQYLTMDQLINSVDDGYAKKQ